MPYDLEHEGGGKCSVVEGSSGDRPGHHFSNGIPCGRAKRQLAALHIHANHADKTPSVPSASAARPPGHVHPLLSMARRHRHCACEAAKAKELANRKNNGVEPADAGRIRGCFRPN